MQQLGRWVQAEGEQKRGLAKSCALQREYLHSSTKKFNCLQSKQKQNNQLSMDCVVGIQFRIHTEFIDII